MNKLNKKIDIREVIIAPVYTRKTLDYKFTGDTVHRHVVHGYNNEFAAIIPIIDGETEYFYNLSNNFELIVAVSSGVQSNKRLVDIGQGKKLIDYLQSSKFSFNENRYISYKNFYI